MSNPRRRRSATHHQNPVRPPLLPPEVRAQLPAWRSTAEESDPVASVKFIFPGTTWVWYLVEFDGEDSCFGLVSGSEVEAGYFSLSELESIYDNLQASGAITEFTQQGAILSPVERDPNFKPTRLSELRRLHQARKVEQPEP